MCIWTLILLLETSKYPIRFQHQIRMLKQVSGARAFLWISAGHISISLLPKKKAEKRTHTAKHRSLKSTARSDERGGDIP